MADYKRLVSYLYNYESGQRKSNVGYSRVEVRNGQCKVRVHLNTKFPDDKPIRVYLFHREQPKILGIYFGDMYVKNGTGDFKGSTSANDLMGTDFRLDDISGVIIYFDTDKFFGSQWDDEDIQIDNFIEYQKDLLTISPRSIGDKTKENQNNTYMPEREGASPSTDSAQEIGEVSEEEMTPSQEMQDSVQNVDTEQPHEDEIVYETNSNMNKSVISPDLSEFETSENNSIDLQKGCRKEKCDCNDNDSKRRENLERVPDRAGFPDCVKQILVNFPAVKPFPDSRPENWVRIEPKDIGMLPVESWILANNSFLLHGYYNYRHLIFGVLVLDDGSADENEGEVQFVIGVPGILHNTEQTMANMFGFHRFLAAKSENSAQGNFGYWIQQIVL